MLPLECYAERRSALTSAVQGPILLLGNGIRCRNLPMSPLPFRQDSTFLYLTGCALPGAAAILDEDGFTLFVPPHADDDALWHGPVTPMREVGEHYGASRARSRTELEACLAGRDWKTLAVPDEGQNAWVNAQLDLNLKFGQRHGSDELVNAIIDLRTHKSTVEINELKRAASASEAAHRAVIAASHPGGHEHGLASLFQAVLAMNDCVLGYGTILTQRGEVLHNFKHTSTLESGRLLLCDGGGEVRSGYGVDITRTWPVSGQFSAQQRDAYEAVLASQEAAIQLCTPGRSFQDVHLEAARVLAQFLIDEQLLMGTVEEVVERGAHALFFPHGIGHHLGMDVHDLENFGDRPSYAPGASRSSQFGLSYLRLNLPLEPGWVVTVEPGFYVIPAVLEDPALRDRLGDLVNWERLDRWSGFGGIRIEDDVLITAQNPEVLTAGVPKSVDDIEALVGTQASPESYLCGR